MSPEVRPSDRPLETVADDRDDVRPDDATLLIVEDDPHYARILVRPGARQAGMKALVAMRGAEALRLASQFRPTGGLASTSFCLTCSAGRVLAS